MSSLYFNNAFSKQPLLEVQRAMLPYIRDEFENPLTESTGAEKARTVLENARSQAARLVNASPSEIFFVSSGTEANNWALKGISQVFAGKKDHIIISSIEHFSVYQTSLFLQRNGFEVSIIPVDKEGRLNADDVARAITPQTFLVSVLAASDEIGVIQPVRELAGLKKRFPEVLFHTDGVQYLCYEELDLQEYPFDLVSFSSNALYGPPGIAALFIREGTRIVPLIHGGMQEEGLRAGLQSIALAAGFAKAADMNFRNKKSWKEKISHYQRRLIDLLDELRVPLTGSRKNRLIDNIHGVFDVDGEALLTLLGERNIQASSGSTCYQYAQKESHVLQGLGIDKHSAQGAVLFTVGIQQTEQDLDVFCEVLTETTAHLRRLKPNVQ
jgi:cysteine desulfurase